ncbi:DUF4340 domain-containing protein [Clostridia bacterium UC5.1-1D4]|nr:DUF4340 domain-containing protein [Clostridia bacterium UC5.1-1D4]
MKKKNTALIAGIIILALLLVFYLVLHNSSKEDSQDTEKTSETAFETTVDDISEAVFKSGENEFKFTKSDDIWKYNGEENFPLDQSAFEEIISKFEKIAADRVLEKPDNISEYGLDDPTVTVSLKDKDGKEQTLQFGDTNSVTSSSYMTLNKDNEKVYMVSSTIVTSLQFDINDLAEKETFPSITDITGVIMERNGQTFSVFKDSSSSTGWTVTGWDGTKKDAGSSQVSEFTNPITSLSWSSFISQNTEDLSQYGLDNPTIITINYQVTETKSTDETKDDSADTANGSNTTDNKSKDAKAESDTTEDTEEKVTVDKQEVLLIGNKTEDNSYYAKLQSQSGVYTLSSSTVDNLLNAEVNQFLSTYVSDYIFADLDKVTIEKDGNTYEFTKKTEEKQVESDSDKENTEDTDTEEEETTTVTTYYMNGKEIELSDFSEFYSLISGMECQERLDTVPDMENSPEMTVHFYKENGVDVTTEYYAYDSSFYLVKDSKGNASLVNKMKVKELTEAFNAFLEKQNKES